jgi:hypothetical protein
LKRVTYAPMVSSDFLISVSLLQWGPIPPSGGPHRERYLDVNGRQSLADADAAYADAIALLGDRARGMPAIHTPLECVDHGLRRKVQREKRAEWIEFARTLDQDTLDAIEPQIRRSEAAAVAALNYLEDHELAEPAHQAIHRAAFVRRGLYGCPVVLRDDEAFWTNCSINMSHLRVGMSAELVSEFECSICGRLVEDCDHVMGEVYDKTASKDDDGNCSICEGVACEHEVGKAYPVVAYANARNVAMEASAMVARPRYPQARVVEHTIDMGAAGDDERVQSAARNGHLNCDACLGPCKGFNDMRTWDERRTSVSEGEEDDFEVDEL